jgi:hypothetical protein
MSPRLESALNKHNYVHYDLSAKLGRKWFEIVSMWDLIDDSGGEGVCVLMVYMSFKVPKPVARGK